MATCTPMWRRLCGYGVSAAPPPPPKGVLVVRPCVTQLVCDCMSQGPDILVCATAEPTTPPPVPSTAKLCRACMRAGRVRMVWVSEVMLPRVLSGELQPVCLSCSYGYLTRDDIELKLAPEQVTQLADLGVLPESVSFVDRLNRALQRHRQGKNRPAGN